MLATDAKMQKIKPDTNVFMSDERLTQHEVVFIFLWAKILDSVCNELYSIKSAFLRSLHTESKMFVCIFIFFLRISHPFL